MTRSWVTAKSRSLTSSSFRSPYLKPLWTSSNPSAALRLPMWPFQSPPGIKTSLRLVRGILTKRLCVYSPFLSTTALENRIGMDTKHPSTWSLGESHNRVSSWWQSPQSQHYGLSSFQHSYYLLRIPLLSASGSSSFFGAHIIRPNGRIVPDHAFQHNPNWDQLWQGCWYRP